MSSEGKGKPLSKLSVAVGVKVKEGVRIDSTDVPPTVLSWSDRLSSHREAVLLLAHLPRYYTEPCREGTC